MQTTISYLGYIITIAPPFVYAALFVWGSESFGDFTSISTNLVPLADVENVIGSTDPLLNTVTAMVESFYMQIQVGIEAIIDLVITLPKQGSISIHVMRTQLSGAIILIACLVSQRLS